MVPGEIFDDALPRRAAHALNNFRMAIQMLDRRRDCIDIAGLDDNSFHAIADDIAGFARGDHWQARRGRFVNGFGAAFESRRKNVNRSLVQIIFQIGFETEDANVFAPKLFQMRFRFIMNAAEQPKLGIAQIQSVPRFEEMMNSFALDQSAGKNRAENWRARSRFEPIDIDAAWQI